MISFEHVTYRYAGADRDAVSDISLEVRPGELTVVTGASGCGKTTLMRLANGLAPQVYGGKVSGRVRVAGRDVSSVPVADLAEDIGTLFQDPEEQFFALNVGDEIAFALRSRGKDGETIRERVNAAAAKLGLSGLLRHDIHALSEGQKQKVGLADILALGPRVLILDEPSANLDPEATASLAATLAGLKEEGCTILVVDHRLYWLKDVADTVVVMSSGSMVRKGPFDILLDDGMRGRYGLRRPAVGDSRMTLPRVETGSSVKAEDPAYVFSARGVDFSYTAGKPVFTGACFAVPPGITALIGGNGAGKTTLARILTGLNPPSMGEFWISGRKLRNETLMPHTGLVLQNADHQLQMRTVYEEVRGAVMASLLARRRRSRPVLSRYLPVKLTEGHGKMIETIISELNLAHLSGRHPQSLSGGEKQRVVIACALAKDPAILILDEPTSGLDGANMAAIAGLLKREAARGRAVFLITHDLELLQACDRALDMRSLQPERRLS